MELYRKHRPAVLTEVSGQVMATGRLAAHLRDASMPHVLLFKGPSGCGKSTLAEIVANGLTVPPNVIHTNCADRRDIDSVREIGQEMATKGFGGHNRVWVLEEAVQLPKATQQAFLDILEKAPEWIYFIFCASDTAGLLPTFLGRCSVIDLPALSRESLTRVVQRSLTLEKRALTPAVLRAIVDRGEGSGRTVLQILEAVLTSEDEETQLALAGASALDAEQKQLFLARAFFDGKTSYTAILPTLSSFDGRDTETIRYQTLEYAFKVLTNPKSQDQWPLAKLVIEAFNQPFHNQRALLAAATHEVLAVALKRPVGAKR
jgi:DNA polymerase III gamma/tau subunit